MLINCNSLTTVSHLRSFSYANLSVGRQDLSLPSGGSLTIYIYNGNHSLWASFWGSRGITRVFIKVLIKKNTNKIKMDSNKIERENGIKVKATQKYNTINVWVYQTKAKETVLYSQVWTYSATFKNKAHFMSFSAIVATQNGTEGSNFHIWNIMTVVVKASDTRLVCIIAFDSHVMFLYLNSRGRCFARNSAYTGCIKK